LPKPRFTPVPRRQARRLHPRGETARLYDLLALLDALERDDLLDETSPLCALFCLGGAPATLDTKEDRPSLSSFNLSNVRLSLPGQK
jgi:hypothetical protein